MLTLSFGSVGIGLQWTVLAYILRFNLTFCIFDIAFTLVFGRYISCMSINDDLSYMCLKIVSSFVTVVDIFTQRGISYVWTFFLNFFLRLEVLKKKLASLKKIQRYVGGPWRIYVFLFMNNHIFYSLTDKMCICRLQMVSYLLLAVIEEGFCTCRSQSKIFCSIHRLVVHSL